MTYTSTSEIASNQCRHFTRIYQITKLKSKQPSARSKRPPWLTMPCFRLKKLPHGAWAPTLNERGTPVRDAQPVVRESDVG